MHFRQLKRTAIMGFTALSSLSACLAPVGSAPAGSAESNEAALHRDALSASETKNPFAGAKWLPGRDKEGPQAVQVRFREGLVMRLKDGMPVDAAGKGLRDKETLALLEKLKGGVWQRAFLFEPEELDRLRTRVIKTSGRPVPDLNLHFTFSPPKGVKLSEAMALLELMADVELVYPMPIYEVATVEDYRFPRPADKPYQRHLGPVEEGGLDVLYAWNFDGGDGEGVDFFDVEYGFEPAHYELGGVVRDFEGWTAEEAFPDTPQSYIDHGTAAMGVVVGDARGPGISGIAPAAGKHFIPIASTPAFDLNYLVAEYCAQTGNHQDSCSNLQSAVLHPLVTEAMSPGDVMLLELQTPGPNWASGTVAVEQQGLVPVEFVPVVHAAIQFLTHAGMVVVEAAGNGSEDLDDPAYATVPSHQPFRMVNGRMPSWQDSGAIIVGAVTSGAPWGWLLDPRPGSSEPLPVGLVHGFSNHGSRVDVHAFGDSVVTSGYGSLYSQDGPLLSYTASFSGTSSASALVAGVATSLQGVYREAYLMSDAASPNSKRSYLNSPAMRRLLKRTGIAKTDPSVLPEDLRPSIPNILNLDPDAQVGMRPNMKAAVDVVTLSDRDCGGPLAAPHLSATPGTTLERTADDIAEINILFSDRAPLIHSLSHVDIVFTTDGSAPDCNPRNGGCGPGVGMISQASAHVWDTPVRLDLSNGPVTLRARMHCWGTFSTQWVWGEEISATYY